MFWIFIALLRFSVDSPSYVFPAHPPTNFHRYYSLTIHYGASELRFQKTLAKTTQCRKWSCHLYNTTAPSCCIPASYCHLSATLQTISIIVVKLQDNRAVFWFVIALLSFSIDSPSYIRIICTNNMHYLLLTYFNNKPLHVSSRLAAHHQEDRLCLYKQQFV